MVGDDKVDLATRIALSFGYHISSHRSATSFEPLMIYIPSHVRRASEDHRLGFAGEYRVWRSSAAHNVAGTWPNDK